ncbi:MAG: toprim domain-containing protein [Methanobacterium sp.]|jgi:5S rRNA maturation endonuclease (ribonuclease M5)
MSFRQLSSIMEELQSYAERGMPILIEGKKDEEALINLGINGNFIKVSGSPLKLYEITEKAIESSSRIIILTDFDKKGNELAKKLSEDIQGFGSHPDLEIRRKIMGITHKYIKDIESLSRHMRQLEFEECPYGVTGNYYHPDSPRY